MIISVPYSDVDSVVFFRRLSEILSLENKKVLVLDSSYMARGYFLSCLSGSVSRMPGRPLKESEEKYLVVTVDLHRRDLNINDVISKMEQNRKVTPGAYANLHVGRSVILNNDDESQIKENLMKLNKKYDFILIMTEFGFGLNPLLRFSNLNVVFLNDDRLAVAFCADHIDDTVVKKTIFQIKYATSENDLLKELKKMGYKFKPKLVFEKCEPYFDIIFKLLLSENKRKK